jgi:zinc/manganese transport system substrate-binding protein/zinc transport system substrate-binding protein
MARSFSGSRVSLIQVVPNSGDPYRFELRPSIVREVARARLLFADGLGIEPFPAKLKPQLPLGARVVELAQGMPELLEAHAEEEG